MPIELKVPQAGESISEVRIGTWRKEAGDFVAADEVVVELETDKAAMELPSPVTGKLLEILKPEGADAAIGDVIALLEEGAAPPPSGEPAQAAAAETAAPEPEAKPEPRVMPAARRVLAQAGVQADEVEGTGPGGRILKEDAVQAARPPAAQPPPARPAAVPQAPAAPTAPGGREEEARPMTPLRRAIARNLVAAQQSAALLTTFNEVDMSATIALRKRFRDAFQQRHGVKLGLMSFFVKACVEALQAVPAVNARIDGDAIVYRKYQDIGIAVGGGRGLVVPVLRNAESMGFAEIERAIADFADRARRNKLELAELQGGTFTISNGGIYGSMLSTPIINPPQSGILGMHAIQERPVAVDGAVAVRPMMYLALTYDHRIIDGREAVAFLRRVKELVEQPERIWLQV